MPAERAGYTVTMFLVDVSPTMGRIKNVPLPPGPHGEERFSEMTHLEHSLRYVKYKIQELIFHERKTDQCGVIIYGCEETDNIVSNRTGGYAHVKEYIPIGTPNVTTLQKLDALQPSTEKGDPLDALIVAIETQGQYLGKKKWTRKAVLVTDGEYDIETEDWEAIVGKMNDLDVSLTIVGVDFDDPDYGFVEEDKSDEKKRSESLYRTFVEQIKDDKGIVGNLDYALQEVVRPEPKQTRSQLAPTILRVGDRDLDPDQALEIVVRTSKCTAAAKPASLKKFALRIPTEDEEEMDVDEGGDDIYAQIKMRTEYYIDRDGQHGDDEEEEGDVKMEEEEERKAFKDLERIEKEDLIRGFKYGTTYVPCPDGQFDKLPTQKGIDICGFFPQKNFRRELPMGEISYVWADPASPSQQVALSSVVKAMLEGKDGEPLMAIARLVTRDGSDAKMGVLLPVEFPGVDCFLWAQMPFADDVRKYAFASLDTLVSKKGEVIEEHPYLPTEEQCAAMDSFVDAMDLMGAEKDEEGNPAPWFDTRLSFNPAVHRIKQAIFHAAVVPNLSTDPLPPPHPDLTLYFEPPPKVIKRSKKALEVCKELFKVKEVPKRVGKVKKADQDHALETDESMLLLDSKPSRVGASQSVVISPMKVDSVPAKVTKEKEPVEDDDSETEDEDDQDLLLGKPGPSNSGPSKKPALPTPTPSDDEGGGVDPGRAPGRIIGSTNPLKDFKDNIARGDVVTKAVEDLGVVVKEIVTRPFASRRTEELMDCLRVLRKTCLEEDEIESWNGFIKDLKKVCHAKPGNAVFWERIKEEGRPMSLISDKEANDFGGLSKFSENDAGELVSS